MTEAEWFTNNYLEDMLYFLEFRGKLSARKARLFEVACCHAIVGVFDDSRIANAIAVLAAVAVAPEVQGSVA